MRPSPAEREAFIYNLRQELRAIREHLMDVRANSDIEGYLSQRQPDLLKTLHAVASQLGDPSIANLEQAFRNAKIDTSDVTIDGDFSVNDLAQAFRTRRIAIEAAYCYLYSFYDALLQESCKQLLFSGLAIDRAGQFPLHLRQPDDRESFDDFENAFLHFSRRCSREGGQLTRLCSNLLKETLMPISAHGRTIIEVMETGRTRVRNVLIHDNSLNVEIDDKRMRGIVSACELSISRLEELIGLIEQALIPASSAKSAA